MLYKKTGSQRYGIVNGHTVACKCLFVSCFAVFAVPQAGDTEILKCVVGAIQTLRKEQQTLSESVVGVRSLLWECSKKVYGLKKKRTMLQLFASQCG